MRILLLEDDRSIQTVVAFALRKAGHVPVQAYTVAQARALVAEEPPDLAVLDVVLPDGDGFSFAKELQAHTDAPLLFLTSRGAEGDRIAGLSLGADDYVAKPFSLEELLLRIERVSRRSRRPAAPVAAAKDRLVIDRAARHVTAGGQALDLTATEFDLLCLIVDHRQQVCTRDFLLDRLGRDNLDKNDRSIDAHVKRLRRKFEATGVDPIRTVRGVGYKYELD